MQMATRLSPDTSIRCLLNFLVFGSTIVESQYYLVSIDEDVLNPPQVLATLTLAVGLPRWRTLIWWQRLGSSSASSGALKYLTSWRNVRNFYHVRSLVWQQVYQYSR